jgi:hypothetical protein
MLLPLAGGRSTVIKLREVAVVEDFSRHAADRLEGADVPRHLRSLV